MKEFLSSKKYTPFIKILGLLLAVLVIFWAGMIVGYHKAQFSAHMGDRYYNAFGKHPHSPLNMMGGVDADDLVSGHGAVGKIISVNLPNVIVSDNNGVEKNVIIDNETSLKSGRESVASTSLTVNKFIVVIGAPDETGRITAKLVRIMPDMQPYMSTSTFPEGHASGAQPIMYRKP